MVPNCAVFTKRSYTDAFFQDTWRIAATTTINVGLRYEFMSPLIDVSNHWSSLFVTPITLTAYIGVHAAGPA